MNKRMTYFMIAIAATGVIRFSLNAAGLPNSFVKYFSMTVIILAGLLYFAVSTDTHKERLKSAYLLVMPYMTVEVLALGYTWFSGRQTIFHAAEYSMGFGVAAHTIGHLVGGLTWEPLFGFFVMELVWAVYAGGRSLLLNSR